MLSEQIVQVTIRREGQSTETGWADPKQRRRGRGPRLASDALGCAALEGPRAGARWGSEQSPGAAGTVGKGC